MFQVKASRSFCPSISMSSRMGTSTSGWDAFSWITAGSWSSKLEVELPTRQRDKLRGSLQEERFKPQSRQDSPSSCGEERVCPEEETLEQRPRGRRVEELLGEQ